MNMGIPLTTGNSYTVVAAVEAINSALEKKWENYPGRHRSLWWEHRGGNRKRDRHPDVGEGVRSGFNREPRNKDAEFYPPMGNGRRDIPVHSRA